MFNFEGRRIESVRQDFTQETLIIERQAEVPQADKVEMHESGWGYNTEARRNMQHSEKCKQL